MFYTCYSISPSEENPEKGTIVNPDIQVRKVNNLLQPVPLTSGHTLPQLPPRSGALSSPGDLLLRIAARNILISCDLLQALGLQPGGSTHSRAPRFTLYIVFLAVERYVESWVGLSIPRFLGGHVQSLGWGH